MGNKGARRGGLPAPLIPSAAEGLVAALHAWAQGDKGPLERWERGTRPALEAALVAWGMDTATSAEAATTILEAAWHSYLKGRTIRNERAWMARVAQRVAARRAAQLRAQTSIPDATPSPLPDPAEEAAERDQRRQERADLRSAIAALPAPYRVAARLRLLRGWTRRRIAAYFLARWEVGEDQARWYLRQAKSMLAFILAGGNAEQKWPARYRTKKKTKKPKKNGS